MSVQRYTEPLMDRPGRGDAAYGPPGWSRPTSTASAGTFLCKSDTAPSKETGAGSNQRAPPPSLPTSVPAGGGGLQSYGDPGPSPLPDAMGVMTDFTAAQSRLGRGAKRSSFWVEALKSRKRRAVFRRQPWPMGRQGSTVSGKGVEQQLKLAWTCILTLATPQRWRR